MSDQQLRGLENGIKTLCKNARFGDGYYWIHPECNNYKLIWNSTDLELLNVKYSICSELFGTGPKFVDTKNHSGRYANAKPIYRLASLVNPIITDYQSKSNSELLEELDIDDVSLWYLDDGGAIKRNDANKLTYRYYICVGNICNTDEKTDFFLSTMAHLFNVCVDKIGKVRKNNSKASVNNKTWYMPISIGEIISNNAIKYNVLHRKIPQAQSSETNGFKPVGA